jgi:DNA-binding NarL/FixJ family response regulator
MSVSLLEADSAVESATDQGAGGKATVLVVDDSGVDSRLVAQLLQPMPELNVSFAGSLSAGLEAIARESPAIVLTDLILPDGEGIELIKQVRAHHPHTHVILMTAYGNEEVVIRSLRAGAANYIAKKDLAADLVPLVRKLLEIAAWSHERVRILRCLVRRESVFVLDNDPNLIAAFMKLVREELEGMALWDETGLIQVSIALQEAVTNAVYHGNLEVDSEHRQTDERIFDRIAEERRHLEPYRSRRVRIHVQLDRDVARFSVCDDGPGFDASLLNRPVTAADLSRIGGRGLLLIRTFMDNVSFNSHGNQIVMLKNRLTQPEGALKRLNS